MGKTQYSWPHHRRERSGLNRNWPEPATKSKSNLVRLSKLPQQKMSWLWHRRIPIGTVTVIEGQQKSGKSLIGCSVAATVTRGGLFPCSNRAAQRGCVIIINPEDDPATVLSPRLAAAGSDLNRIAIPKEKWPTDISPFIEWLEGEIKKVKRVRAVILDPITGVVSINRNNADQVRAVLTALSGVAARHDIAVVVVVHLNKSAGTQALMRASGSFEWTAASRAGYLVVAEGRTGRHLLVPLPNNIGLNSKGLAFRVKNKKLEDGGRAPAVVWEDKPVTTSADDALARNRHSATTTEAIEFLRQTVSQPISAKNIIRLGRDAGFSAKELRTARERLGMKPKRVGGIGSKGKWMWPPAPDAKLKQPSRS
jgi:putative DNA primase/helicase